MTRGTRFTLLATLLGIALLAACGGGNSSSSNQDLGYLTITTASDLPGTMRGAQYSTTLSATGGHGALHWSIAPISSTALFVSGVTMDAASGTLSGQANWDGTAAFIATVTDSASRTATQGFTLTAYARLQTPAPQTFAVTQYQQMVVPSPVVNLQSGVFPLHYTLTSGTPPPGTRFDNMEGSFTGSPTTRGSYNCTIQIQDSFTPPEVVNATVTLNVVPPALQLHTSLPTTLLLNRPVSYRAVAIGGIPPYQVSASGLPPGLALVNTAMGTISGTPSAEGMYYARFTASDSSSPAQTISGEFGVRVMKPLGRNDSPATATTTIANAGNSTIGASISPYIDPPDGTPAAGDNDYYKYVSLGGSTVHLETWAKRDINVSTSDTVLELVDGNGVRLNTCRQPGDTSQNFTSACVNDDIAPGNQDSALDLLVPGPTNQATSFFAHVLDWRGDARPDMFYGLIVNGLVAPLSVQTTTVLPAARGVSYMQQLTAANGNGPISWSVVSGSLPPGLTISGGAITGSATADGTYNFTLQANDSSTPPQTATAPAMSIPVVEPVQITSSGTLPNACVNRSYSFTVQISGGLPPLRWGLMYNNWPTGFDQTTETFIGTPSMIGTYTGQLSLTDATNRSVSQQVSLTVKQCP